MPLARIDEFIDKLKPLTRISDIKPLCESELHYLRTELDIFKKYSDEGYAMGVHGDARRLKTQVSAYRNAIRELPTNSRNSTSKIKNGSKVRFHKALRYFNLADYEKQDVNQRDRARVTSDKIDRPSFDPTAIIGKAKSLLKSNSYISKVAGLYLLTGRRHGEILITARFDNPLFDTVADPILDGWLQNDIDSALFSGQSKRKGNSDTPYNIPLLAPLETVVEAIDWLRVNKPHKVGQRASGSKELGYKVKREFQKTSLLSSPSGKEGSVSPHNLRSAYCAICWHLYRQSEYASRCTEDLFVKSIMGHLEDSTESAQSYLDYEILD